MIVAGTDPGLVASDQDESTLDVEWSGAVAPDAAVNLVVAASTPTTDGVDLASQYIVNHATAPVVSVSYGSCEREMGTAELAFYNSLWEQAASQGMSVFVASGDAGAAGCEAGADTAGIGERGERAVQLAVCDLRGRNGVQRGRESRASTGPRRTRRVTDRRSSYIPEEVWNESALNGGTGLWASGGGASTVYAQPAWQAEVNGAGAANGMRAVPDVALSAADHDGYFMVENGSYWIVSGTSVASPAFAGVMALVVDKQSGAEQGNANARLVCAGGRGLPIHFTPRLRATTAFRAWRGLRRMARSTTWPRGWDRWTAHCW